MQLLRKFSNGQDVLLANIGILLIIGATSMIEVQILVMVVLHQNGAACTRRNECE